MAIDYGTKRVGMAVSDPLKIFATSLGTVRAMDVIDRIKKFMEHEQVEQFVVGKPTRLDGSDSQSAVHVEKFVSLLSKNFPDIPIARVDERFTSVIAQRTLLEMGLKKKERQKKENVDQLSAVLILQSYLEQFQ